MAGNALDISKGGTSQTTAAGARIALGLEIGSDIQAWDADLDAVAALSTTGIVVRTTTNTWTTRTLTGTANEITLTNGDGVSGNPVVSIPSAITFTGKTVTGGTFNSGAFAGSVAATTLSASSTVTLKGSITNDSAAAGNIGEILSSSLVVGSATALTTATAKTVTSVSLTAGDWDVYGSVGYAPGATTSITQIAESISQTNNTLDITEGSYASNLFAALVPTAVNTALVMPSITTRISLSGTTTVYLVAQATFTISTLSAYGRIWARRAR